jgi:hypothetical protein
MALRRSGEIWPELDSSNLRTYVEVPMAGALKVQGTLRGYSAWIVEQLKTIKGEPLSDITKQIIDRWVDDNPEFLRGLNLTHENYHLAEERRKGKVVDFDRKESG